MKRQQFWCSVNAHHPQGFKCFFPWLLLKWMIYFRMALCQNPGSTEIWMALISPTEFLMGPLSVQPSTSNPCLSYTERTTCSPSISWLDLECSVVMSPALSPSPPQVPWPWIMAYSGGPCSQHPALLALHRSCGMVPHCQGHNLCWGLPLFPFPW